MRRPEESLPGGPSEGSSPAPGRLELFFEAAEQRLDSYVARVVFSTLIILSVLPPDVLVGSHDPAEIARVDLLFFFIFAPEFLVRLSVYLRRWRQGRATGTEPLLLLLDFVAVLSFLPWHWFVVEAAYLRLARLTRIVLLLGYWGGMVRDLWGILSSRERRGQVLFVVFLGAILSFGGAVVLAALTPDYDFSSDGVVDSTDRSFGKVLWWSFRQVQDPGNLVQEPTGVLVVLVSIGLTLAGLLLFSFLVGIGTGAIDELMSRSQARPVGLRAHTVILGLGPYGHFLLTELDEIYRKNLRPLRAAILDRERRTPDYLRDAAHRRFHYRTGDPVRPDDLERVDVGRARRVLVVGRPGGDGDAEVISSILAVRDLNPTVDLYPVLEHEKNFQAARTAGGASTHLVGSGSFLGHYLAQNVLHPGIFRVFRQLLTSVGAEIYTYVLDEREHADLAGACGGAAVDPVALADRARVEHGVALLGVFVHDPDAASEGEVQVDDLEVLLNPTCARGRETHPWAFDGERLRRRAIRGFVGVSLRWDGLRSLARAELAGSAGAEGAPVEDPGAPAGVRFVPPAAPVRRLLICGGSPRGARVLFELARFYGGGLDVTVLVRDRERLEELRPNLRGALETYLAGLGGPLGERTTATLRDDGTYELRFTLEDEPNVVRVFHADWTDPSQVFRDDRVDLSAMDAICFLPTERADQDLDGMVALDCLRMAHYEASGAIEFAPGLRIVGMIREPGKGDLLEKRLERLAGQGHHSDRFSIISGERLRHHYVMQNIFVKGLNTVYLALCGAAPQHLCRLVPVLDEGADPTFDPGALARHLSVARGMVLVGIELRRPGTADRDAEPEVVLDATRLGRMGLVAWKDVRAVYLLGRGRELARA